MEMDDIIRHKTLKKLKSLKLNTNPFKHAIIDNFFTDKFLQELLDEFPRSDPVSMLNEFGSRSYKHVVPDITKIGWHFQKLDELISQDRFLSLISSISGIPNLIYDPTYYGGGTHNNLSGQGMDAHVDFNYLDIPNIGKVHRRLNIIIYLNEEWEADWGGVLNLHENPWDPENDKIISVVPTLNKMVIFETNEHSWHGFKPVSAKIPHDVSRKSIALYFYTKERPQHEIAPEHGTFYVPSFPNISEWLKEERISEREYHELDMAFKHSLKLLNNQYARECDKSKFIEDRQYEISSLTEKVRSLKDLLHSTGIEQNFSIFDWGPKILDRHSPPNLQPNGEVGLWIKCKNVDLLTDPYLILGNGSHLPLTVDGDLMTTSISRSIFQHLRDIKLSVIEKDGQSNYHVGKITIE